MYRINSVTNLKRFSHSSYEFGNIPKLSFLYESQKFSDVLVFCSTFGAASVLWKKTFLSSSGLSVKFSQRLWQIVGWQNKFYFCLNFRTSLRQKLRVQSYMQLFWNIQNELYKGHSPNLLSYGSTSINSTFVCSGSSKLENCQFSGTSSCRRYVSGNKSWP